MNKISEQKWVEQSGPAVTLAFDAAPVSATLVKPLYLDTIGAVTSDGNVQQGTNASDRIGDRFRLRRLSMKGVVIPSTGVGACRIIVGQVTDQQDPAAPTLRYGDVLYGLLGSGYSCITAQYEHDPLVKYRILADEVYTWDANNASAPRLFNFTTSRFKHVNINCEGSSDLHTGMLFYIIMSANGLAMNINNVTCRLTYVDY